METIEVEHTPLYLQEMAHLQRVREAHNLTGYIACAQRGCAGDAYKAIASLFPTTPVPGEHSLVPGEAETLSVYGTALFTFRDKTQAFVMTPTIGPGAHVDSSSAYLLVDGEETLGEVRPLLAKRLREQQIEGRGIQVYGEGVVRLSRGYTWEDLCWPPEMVEDVRRNVEFFLERKDWFEQRRVPYKRGFLLAGPPGNGKTLLVKILLSEYPLMGFAFNFYSEHATGQIFTEMFGHASANGPALILLEDLDRVLTTARQGGKYDVKIGLDALLNTMDGVGENPGVLVVATANELDKVDPALRQRPRRFDRVYSVGNPDSSLRARFVARLFPYLDRAGQDWLVQHTEGFSMAFLEEVYIKANIDACNDRVDNPTARHVREALNQILCHWAEDRTQRTGFSAFRDRPEPGVVPFLGGAR